MPAGRPYVRRVSPARLCTPLALLALLLAAPPAFARGSVLYVGDSLGVGTWPQLRPMLHGVSVEADAKVGRNSSEGLSVLRTRLGRRHGIVVFDLGTNDWSVGTLSHNLTRAHRLSGQRLLVVFTMNKPGVAPFNRAVVDFARSTANVLMIDWHAMATRRRLLAGDGIHATTSGYHRRAAQIERKIASRAR